MGSNVIQFEIKGIDKFSGAMKKAGDSLLKFAKVAAKGIAATAALAVGVFAFTKRMASGIDITGKFATRIGVAVDQLSAMQHVAALSNISTEQFNMATQRMTRRVAEAAEGMGEAQGALRELGIDAKHFKGLGLEDQMATLAKEMERVEDPADRLRLGFKLFDSEGTAMLQMLNNGSEAMRAAAKDAAFLGKVISKEAAANAAAFGDSMTRAGAAVTGVGRGIANEFMPILTGLSNRFADSLASARGNIVTFVRDAVVKFFTFIEVIKQVFDGVYKIFTSTEGFSAFLDNLGIFIRSIGVSVIAFGEMFVKAFPMIFMAAFKSVGAIADGFGKWIGGALFAFIKGGEAQDFSEAMAQTFANAVTAAKNEIAGLADAVETPIAVFKASMADAGSAIADGLGINLDAAQAKAMATIASISEFGKIAKEEIATTGVAVSDLMTSFNEQQIIFMDGLRTNSEQFAQSFFSIMNQTIDSISNGVAQVIVQGGSMLQVFKNIGQQVLQQLIASLVKMGVQRLILMAVTKGAVVSESTSEIAKASAATYANAFASTAAIPIIGPALAPGVAAASNAAMLAGAGAAGAAGAGVGAAVGAAHGGLTNVPNEATYLLNKGERVLSPNQNSDFTNFINGGGGGQSVVIENLTVHVMENATSGDTILNMDKTDLREKVAMPLIEAMDDLYRKGVGLEAFEERRR